MVGRVLLLIAAFVVAGLGALLVYLYANQADERAAAEYDLVQVLVVQAPIAVGTSVSAAIEQDQLLLEDRPSITVPEDAVSDPTEVQGLVTLTGLVTGETLVRGRVGDPADQRQFELDEGLIAVSFPFQEFQKVANFVTPGAEVAVLVTYDGPPVENVAPADGEAPPAPAVDGADRTTRMLLDRVRVLAVGATTSTEEVVEDGAEGETATVPATILTLALTKDQAEAVVLGDDLGDLYLGLLNEASLVPPGDGTDTLSLFEVAAQ